MLHLNLLANVITADMGLIPGLALIGPLCGLPLSVLAAIIERPFYTAGGIKHHTVWYSIQANFISLIIGYPMVVGIALFETAPPLILLWPVLAILISTGIEREYINRRTGWRRLGFGWAFGGNFVSALLCMLIMVPVTALDRPDIKETLRPWQIPLGVVLGVFCLVAVIAAFLVTGIAAARALKIAAARDTAGTPVT